MDPEAAIPLPPVRPVALDLTWPDLDHCIAITAEQVRAAGIPDVVVGILRAGMIPAVMLAHRLGIRRMRAVEAVGARETTPTSLATQLGDLAGRDVLLVDDFASSGATIRAVASAVRTQDPAQLRIAIVIVNSTSWVTRCGADPFRRYDHVGAACGGAIRFPWER